MEIRINVTVTQTARGDDLVSGKGKADMTLSYLPPDLGEQAAQGSVSALVRAAYIDSVRNLNEEMKRIEGEKE